MSRLEERQSVPIRPREVPAARSRADRAELSETAIRATEEGRTDHVAGRTFTLAEIKRKLGIDS